jgi:hypothetical protein
MKPDLFNGQHIVGKRCWCKAAEIPIPCWRHRTIWEDPACNDCIVDVRHRIVECDGRTP